MTLNSLHATQRLFTVYSMQYNLSTLIRDNISDALVIELRHLIVDGRLAEGER